MEDDAKPTPNKASVVPRTAVPRTAVPRTAVPRSSTAPKRPPRYDLRRETLEQICQWTAVRAGGPGGQHRNKSFTGVRLVHPPSGIVITATERRSQHRNLDAAYERLIEQLRAKMHRQKKRKKTKIPRAVNRKRLEGKKKRADIKKGRGKVKF